VNSQQEEQDEYQTGNCEERMIHQGLSEGDLFGMFIRKPLPSATRRANGYQNENDAPSCRRRAQITYYLRQSPFEGLEIFSLLE